MAFDPLQMSLFVGANGNSIWYYKSTADNHAAIIAANYFGLMAPVLNVGDMIVAHDSAGTNDILFVKTSNGDLLTATVAAALAAPVVADAGEGTKEALAAQKERDRVKDIPGGWTGATGATGPYQKNPPGATGRTDLEPRDETPAEMRRREKKEEEEREKREQEQENHRQPPHRR